jgi:hypothetical protein
MKRGTSSVSRVNGSAAVSTRKRAVDRSAAFNKDVFLGVIKIKKEPK